MSAASDLIERAERESGKRIDDPDNQVGMAILFGALARAMGKSKFEPKDDAAVGIVIMDDIANGEQRRRSNELMAQMLTGGMSPDELKSLLG